MSRDVLDSISAEYRRYKKLGEGALAQATDEELSRISSPDDNSLAMIVWHIAGNLKSRFTDFETTDGEKPWRNRDEEFDQRTVTRSALMAKWEDGWQAVFAALDGLTDEALHKVVTIRQQPLTIHQALHRSMTHTSYHVGQMVYIAKAFRGQEWKSLSIPRGASREFMAKADPMQRSAKERT
jgi:uncharacterized damage-inducible protein DinB